MKKIILFVGVLFVIISTSAQTKEERQKIRAGSNINKLESLQLKYQSADKAREERIKRLAPVYKFPIYKPNPKGGFDQLMDISEDGRPIYFTLHNVDAAHSTRTDHLNTGGSLGLNLNGENMTAHVWDGGPARTTHQEFGGRVSIGDGVVMLNGNSNHATHVTGTIGAAGVDPNAQGMAPQSDIVTHDWNNDLAEATVAAASGMLVSNHSYGYVASSIPDWYFGAYIGVSQAWDDLMFNAPYYLMVKSAGNTGNDDVSNGLPLSGNAAYDKLRDRGTSKNNLVVANAQDANVDVNGNLIGVNINSSSSEGPTDDLRIKPDITGNGTAVYSSVANSDNGYNGGYSGTSMSSPNITGTLLLLQQHYNTLNGNFMRAATLKGLALHTADDAGDAGPDAVFGWGLLNALRSAETIAQNGSGSLIQELTLNDGGTFIINVNSDNVNPLIASISWTDPPGVVNPGIANDNTPVLINDLDIRITQGGATHFPYMLTGVNTNGTGDNIVDPYERVDVAGASESYNIIVTHKGNLINELQNFSLIITGITATACLDDVTVNQNVIGGNTDIREANQTITANNIVFNNATAIYHAGNQVVLQPGFHAQNGSEFHAYIEGCSGIFQTKMQTQDIKIPGPFTSNTPDEEQTIVTNVEENISDPEPVVVFPNPFTHTTTFQYTVKQANSPVLLQVYNASGETVATLVNAQNVAAGNYQVQFDGSSLPSGLYLYRLKMGDTVKTGKIILKK